MAANTGFSYSLELTTGFCGILKDFDGGGAFGTVITEPPDPDGTVLKRIGQLRYEDIVLKFGADMDAPIYTWMAQALELTDGEMSGVIGITSRKAAEGPSRFSFFQALIREIAFPALSSDDPATALFEIKLAPLYTTHTQRSAARRSSSFRSRRLLASKFRLQIDGIDCRDVTSVNAMTISRPMTPAEPGVTRFDGRSVLNVSNLSFTIREKGASSLKAWHQDFLINGNNGIGAEKNGALLLLSKNSRDVLFTLQLGGLGIFRLVPEKVAAGRAPQMRAEMYCKRITFQTEATMANNTG